MLLSAIREYSYTRKCNFYVLEQKVKEIILAMLNSQSMHPSTCYSENYPDPVARLWTLPGEFPMQTFWPPKKTLSMRTVCNRI